MFVYIYQLRCLVTVGLLGCAEAVVFVVAVVVFFWWEYTWVVRAVLSSTGEQLLRCFVLLLSYHSFGVCF